MVFFAREIGRALGELRSWLLWFCELSSRRHSDESPTRKGPKGGNLSDLDCTDSAGEKYSTDFIKDLGRWQYSPKEAAQYLFDSSDSGRRCAGRVMRVSASDKHMLQDALREKQSTPEI
jgi:hypothetical protein